MREKHPYGAVYLPKHPKAMLIGSFPIGKFSNPKRRNEIKPHEYDFYFGGEKNLLWKLLGATFGITITSKEDIVEMLEVHGLGIGDVIHSCKRKNGRGSDADLYDIEWNTDLLRIIDKHHIKLLFFTSKSVETWFKRLFPSTPHLKKISLITPSGQVLRTLHHREDFQKWVKKHPHERKIEFIKADYAKKFEALGR